MDWQSRGDMCVSAVDVAKEVTVRALMADTDATNAAIAEDSLAQVQALFPDVTKSSLAKRIGKIRDEAVTAAQEGATNVYALACLHYGELFPADRVQVVSWAAQNKQASYAGQRVAARLYTRNMAPYETAQVGDLVIGKSGAVFGFTRVTDVHYETAQEESKESMRKCVQAARDTLAEMADGIDDDATLLLGNSMDSQQYWSGTASFAESSRKGTKETYKLHISLFTFEDWVNIIDLAPREAEGTGTVRIDLSLGKGARASWYSGIGTITEGLAEGNWFLPAKRGRKPGQKNKKKS